MALLWALIGSVEARADGVLPAAFAPGSQCHIALVGQSIDALGLPMSALFAQGQVGPDRRVHSVDLLVIRIH